MTAHILLLALIPLAAIALWMRLNEPRMIYFPERAIVTSPQQLGMKYEDAWLTAKDGVRLNGWFMPSANSYRTDRAVRGLLVDAAVTRALFSATEFIKKAGKILKGRGLFILSKGPKVDEELRELHTEEICREDILLPFQKGIRYLVTIRSQG